MKLIKMVMVSLLFFTTQAVLASNDLFNEEIVRIINQLNAIKPIIRQAQRYQPKNKTQTLHLTQFRGADNKLKNGVLEDVELIKKGLIAYLNKPLIAPKAVSPIEGDFIERLKKG